MNAQAICWLVFLALIKSAFIITDFSHAQLKFRLLDTELTAKEGSCIEIKCKVVKVSNELSGNWFWIKGAYYHKEEYRGTIIYSTNNSTYPVSPDFAERVKYIGFPSSRWKDSEFRYCSILICNLNKSDSGNYSFRFVGLGTNKWMTKPPVILTVTENPCPITFEEPAVVKESETVTLTCSTLMSCPSKLQVEGLTPSSQTPHQTSKQNGKHENTIINFAANWQDDGRKFSCQTQDNKDTYLTRNISLTVEYAPKNTEVKMTPSNIVEGQTVILTCSAKGRPDPTFTWFKKEQKMENTGAEWKIQSINDTKNGEYHCVANNKHGTLNSSQVIINVTYIPQLEVMMSPLASVVKEGDKITLTCNVKRSNPQPHTYNWLRNNSDIGLHTYQYVKYIEPEDRGFYTCSATNTAGTGKAEPLTISVQYGPRDTKISSSHNVQVKIDTPLTFSCHTDANPAPSSYSWARCTKDFSEWKYYTTSVNKLKLERVQRTDEACYMCNATNNISAGPDSESLCIDILYPPTNVRLSMNTEVEEGQNIIINCTAESFPLSSFTIKKGFQTPLFVQQSAKSLQQQLTATSDKTGNYTCIATNTEGSKQSSPRELVVKYRPRNVRVQAHPDLTVTENASLTLNCDCKSYPAVTSVTWMKTTDGKRKILQKTQSIKLDSVGTSHSGLYSCSATNEIGTGESEEVEVKVKYAPRSTKITKSTVQQNPDGTSLMKLTCSSHSYPPVHTYSWYRKTDKGNDIKVSSNQNYTASSHRPGVYYCVARNEINQGSSDPEELFVDRSLMKLLYLVPIILLIIVVLLLVHRHKRKKSMQRGNTNIPCCFGLLGWWDCGRQRNLMNDPVIAEPFRSRDDLLPQQPCHPRAQRRQPRPDSTPASNNTDIYSTVNLPAGKHGPSAQKPIRQQGRHTEDESLNYASLHFGNNQTNKQTKADENIVYAMVSKLKSPKKNEQERLADYENVSAVKPPNPLDSDSDTSEDEVEVNYSQVSFKAKCGHQKASRDSSSDDSTTSDEEKTQYSEVKI